MSLEVDSSLESPEIHKTWLIDSDIYLPVSSWIEWFSFFELFIYLSVFFGLLGLCCCVGVSLVAVSRGYPLLQRGGFLFLLASLVAEHKP